MFRPPQIGALNDLASEIYNNAKAKGFHEYKPEVGVGGVDARHLLSWMALITSEVSEAVEAIRVGDKRGLAEELADVLIRTLDACAALDINIGQQVISKIEKNRTREVKHGGKLA